MRRLAPVRQEELEIKVFCLPNFIRSNQSIKINNSIQMKMFKGFDEIGENSNCQTDLL